MKNILFIGICMLVMLAGCGKEDELQPELKPVHLYEIKDNPSDSVQHRVYQIYQEYGVPVYFNDTIGKVFVSTNIYGDSVFQYELLDPAWTFTGYSNLKYQYTYMTDPAEKILFLNMIEDFLKKCSSTMYPYSIFVVNEYQTKGYNNDITLHQNGKYSVFYKLLLLTGDADTPLDEMPDLLVRSIIENHITDYIDLLAAFNRVSKEWVNAKNWAALGIDKLGKPYQFTAVNSYGYEETYEVTSFTDYPIYGGTSCLADTWWGIRDLSAETVELTRKAVRYEIGKYGFVGPSVKNTFISVPPVDGPDDLKAFVKEVMRYPKKEFETIWGESPLVMQKYAILADIIENELGVKL